MRRKSLIAGHPVGMMLLLGVLVGATILRWRIITASAISFATFPFAYIENHTRTLSIVSIDVADHWLAAIVWVIVIGLLCRSLYQTIFTAGRTVGSSVFDGRSKEATVGLLFLLTLFFGASTAPILAPMDPLSQGDLFLTRMMSPFSKLSLEENDIPMVAVSGSPAAVFESAALFLLERDSRYAAPSLPLPGKNVTPCVAILGTDDYGRDIFSRVLYGSRYSLDVGICVLLLSLLAGSLVGYSAGYFGGWIDVLLMRFCDVLLSIPSLFITIALMAFLGGSIPMLIMILGITGWMGIARIIRGEVLHIREREFVLAAELLGVPSWRIMKDHILPHTYPVLMTASVLQLGNIILAEASLSFLGLGIRPPTPSWGNMIGDSLANLSTAWWIGVFPGASLSLLLIALHLLSGQEQCTAN
ncbi:MAG: ABC transporter permease [Ignavibacteriales bacterium]|nr:ABC transporter permease [Ignavibacteriales bacterium]